VTLPIDLGPVKFLNWGRGIHADTRKARRVRSISEADHPKKEKVVMKMEPKGIKKFTKLLTGFFRRGDR